MQTINTQEDVEPALVEFLEGFYPLMKNAHRANRNMHKMKIDFMALDNAFPIPPDTISFPTGHALAIILQ
ncbi:hypothetical protein VNI00_018919, partial [Paramarasmius palmivorus]